MDLEIKNMELNCGMCTKNIEFHWNSGLFEHIEEPKNLTSVVYFNCVVL